MSLLDDGASNTTEIPHENLLSGCFRELFKDCKILERGPETPATVLSEYCYHFMFTSCVKLKYVSNLPAGTKYASTLYVRMNIPSSSPHPKNAQPENEHINQNLVATAYD